MNILSYSVDAGKYDTMMIKAALTTVRNYKYCDTVATLEEALRAYNLCLGYPFREITMHVEINGKKYDIVLDISQKLEDATNSGEI